MSDLQDTFKQLSKDEKLLMQINSNPTRGIRIIDVGNATEEVALEEVRRLKEKYKGI